MDEEQTRTSTRELIVQIVTSGASHERMEEMLRDVHKVEVWPWIWRELNLLEGEGEGDS